MPNSNKAHIYVRGQQVDIPENSVKVSFLTQRERPGTAGQQAARRAVTQRMIAVGLRTPGRLAARAGVSYNAVHQWLSHTRAWPRSNTRAGIEQALGWELGSLDRIAALADQAAPPEHDPMPAGETTQRVGASIRSLRMQLAQSLAEMARGLAGRGLTVSIRELGELETGQRAVTVDELGILAAYFDVDPGDLLHPAEVVQKRHEADDIRTALDRLSAALLTTSGYGRPHTEPAGFEVLGAEVRRRMATLAQAATEAAIATEAHELQRRAMEGRTD